VRCPIPIVTGVGHETDVSIADLLADYHAHTPTEAAQVVTANWRVAGEVVDGSALRLRREMRGLIETARQRLASVERHEAFRRPLDRINGFRQLLDDRQRALALSISGRMRQEERRINDLKTRLECFGPAATIGRLRERIARLAVSLSAHHPRNRLALVAQRLDSVRARLGRGMECEIQRHRLQVDSLSAHLEAIGPEQVLKRGYSLTTIKKTGAVVRSASQIKGGERLATRLADGEIESVSEDPQQPKLFE
jgi:exodeoxyribonuclease VII large subunit